MIDDIKKVAPATTTLHPREKMVTDGEATPSQSKHDDPQD